MIQIHEDSHLDHGLTQEQIDYVLAFAWEEARIRDLDERGILKFTVALPEDLGDVDCALVGPCMGDDPRTFADRTVMQRRGARTGESRMLVGPMRGTRKVSIIAGPHDGLQWVLFTIFGGPVAPREPFDVPKGTPERAESEAFWSEHALLTGGSDEEA